MLVTGLSKEVSGGRHLSQPGEAWFTQSKQQVQRPCGEREPESWGYAWGAWSVLEDVAGHL